MTRILNGLTHTFLLSASAGLLSACGGASNSDTALDPDKARTLQVTGVGEVTAMPDTFVIAGAVIKQDEDLTTAMNAVADIINTAQTALPAIDGIGTADFNFASVNSAGIKAPECLLFNQEAQRTNNSLRENEKRIEPKICKDITQQASVTFTFTGGPPELAGNAISQLAEAGAIRLKLNGYRISNIDEIELQAGEMAVQNARDKADRLTAAAGGKVLGVKNLNAYTPTYQTRNSRAPSVSTSGAGESARLFTGDDTDAPVTEMNLKPGPQAVTASITLEFIYE